MVPIVEVRKMIKGYYCHYCLHLEELLCSQRTADMRVHYRFENENPWVHRLLIMIPYA